MCTQLSAIGNFSVDIEMHLALMRKGSALTNIDLNDATDFRKFRVRYKFLKKML